MAEKLNVIYVVKHYLSPVGYNGGNHFPLSNMFGVILVCFLVFEAALGG